MSESGIWTKIYQVHLRVRKCNKAITFPTGFLRNLNSRRFVNYLSFLTLLWGFKINKTFIQYIAASCCKKGFAWLQIACYSFWNRYLTPLRFVVLQEVTFVKNDDLHFLRDELILFFWQEIVVDYDHTNVT